MRSHRPLPVLVVLAAMLVVSSCSSAGRDAAEPERERPRHAPPLRTPSTADAPRMGPAFVIHTYAPEALQEFERWLGRPIDGIQLALNRQSWDTIEDPREVLREWEQTRRRGREVYLNVPMLTARGSTLAECGAGRYDAHFETLAERLVDLGLGNSVLRLGHEPNGHWFPWSAAPDPDRYIDCWRSIVSAMRSVDGAFLFDWSIALGPQDVPADRAYPGNEWVDVVGIDVYDQDWQTRPGSSDDWRERRWERLRSAPYGLDWIAAFAEERGKSLSVGEWGLTTIDRRSPNAGGDNPAFVQAMHAWISEHDVLYHAYFERDVSDGYHRLLGPHFPEAGARFRELFGGRGA